MNIIYAEKYVSPRDRPLTPEEQEVRRIAYALKVPTFEATYTASFSLGPLVEGAVGSGPGTVIVLMPVPSSTNSVEANRRLACSLAARIRMINPRRRVFVKPTVARTHPVESSCLRRRAGNPGLSVEEHAMVRVAGPLYATNTEYYFVDNVAATGTTLEACRQALGFGDGIVWADQGKERR